MFKNYDKVFKFTFKNQTGTKGYRNGTVIVALLLFFVPVIIFSIIGLNKRKGSDLKPCGATSIYVSNPANTEIDFGLLNTLNVPGYTSLSYKTFSSVTDALSYAKENDSKTSLVLNLTNDDGQTSSTVIIPEGSEIEKKDAKNYQKFIDENNQLFSVLASGVELKDLPELSKVSSSDSYTLAGIKTGTGIFEDSEAMDDQTNSTIRPIFNMVLVYITTMVMYFIVIVYGTSIMQNVVLEKSSKLMDTMLISLKPQAMIMGKMLGSLSAALIQFFSWIISLVLGMVVAVFAYKTISPDNTLGIVTFFESFGKLGIFTPGAIVIAVLVLIFGIVFYAAIATICGAISSSKEEVAANQGLFMMVLMISFYVVLFGGLKSTGASAWMYILPCTGAMLLPAGICSGTVELWIAITALVVSVVSTILLVILSGKLYTMMALYKGNKVNLGKALKMLVGK